uniref:Secreted protein n=1 Tax=Arundo donax TaxID=35708 RepID=A0A0A9H5X4_ARUDO
MSLPLLMTIGLSWTSLGDATWSLALSSSIASSTPSTFDHVKQLGWRQEGHHPPVGVEVCVR